MPGIDETPNTFRYRVQVPRRQCAEVNMFDKLTKFKCNRLVIINANILYHSAVSKGG